MGEYVKKLDAGRAFHKLGDYYKAEMVFMELLREYPGKAEVYEGLVCTITRNYTLFITENVERVYKLMDKMILVASEVEKPHYMELQEKVIAWYGEGMIKQAKEENLEEIAKLNKMLREQIIIAIGSMLFAFALLGSAKGNFLLSRIGLLACVVAIWSVVMYFVNGRKKDKLVKKKQELEDSIL